MRKLALVITALSVVVAASVVTNLGALAATSTRSPAATGPHSGARSSPMHMPSMPMRVPSISTSVTPAICDAGFHFVASPTGPGASFLVSTSAVNASDIWAVGNSTSGAGWDQTLAEHWNGAGWTVFTTPNPGAFHNDFTGVVAIAANDVYAVGTYWGDASNTTEYAFVQHWDGTAWSAVTIVNPSSTVDLLFGVTATSSTDVWAVGLYQSGGAIVTLIEHWNGTIWSVVTSANANTFDNELFAVSAFSATDAWAVGGQSTSSSAPLQSLAEHWNGSVWSVVTTPNLGVPGSENSILGVTALEAGHAVGVGYGYYTFDTNFNTLTPRQGAAWDLVATGTSAGAAQSGPGAGHNALLAVARSGAGLWAVGYWRSTNFSPRQTLVFPATWNATSHTLTWGPVGTSDSPSALNNALIGVTAISPYSFWATGYDTNGAVVNQTLTEAYCARNFNMSGPTGIHATSAFSVTVTVKNGNGTTATGYGGNVHFTSTDGIATLPANYGFVPGDNGAHTFSGVVLRTAGSQTITVADIDMPLTVPALITVQVCVGLCQSPAGTPGSRPTNPGPSGTKGGRSGVFQSGAGAPGPRLPRLGLSSRSSDSAPSTAPATTTGQATNFVAAAPAAASTSVESAPTAAGAAEAATSTTSVQASAHGEVSLVARRQAVARPPDETPWSVLLLIPLLACALALVALRRRIFKEKSNARIRP